MTLGVMQVRTNELIDDRESVRKGVDKILLDLQEIKSKRGVDEEVYEWEVLSKLLEKFNGGKSYNQEVSELFWIVWKKFYANDTPEVSFLGETN
jgi:hypothetical protein